MYNSIRKYSSGGSAIIIAIMTVHVLNFVFNSYLGRVLSFEDFGLITLFTTFLYLFAVPFNALNATVNQRSAYLNAYYNSQAGLDFFKNLQKKTFFVALVLSLIWIVLIPVIDKVFHINNFIIPLLFTPIISLGFLTAANKGYLQGGFHFKAVGIILLVDVICKLFFAWIFVQINHHTWVYLSIPLSIAVAYTFSQMVTPTARNTETKQYAFPKKFFVASLVTGFSSMAFLTFDVLLAKYYLSPIFAGQYALLSLIGKMIYFFGLLPSTFLITLVSSDEGNMRNPNRNFYKLFAATVFLTGVAFVGLAVLGQYIIPFLFGNKAHAVLPYLTIYGIAISFFAISSTITSFHLVLQQYLFSFVAIGMAFIMSLGIIIFHRDIYQITYVIFYTSLLSFATTSLLHVLETKKIIQFQKGWI